MMKNSLKIVIGIIIATTWISCSEDTLNENGVGNITGTVVKVGNNTPLANVKISTSPASTTVFTDTTGSFVLSGVSSGEYAIQAELDEYLTSFEAANVVDGQTVNVVFELEKSTTNNRPPEDLLLLFPADNAENIGGSIEFAWSSSDPDDDDIEYTLQLRNGENNEVLLFESILDTVFSVNNLRIGTNYFWEIEATDNINDPVQSGVQSFSTANEDTNRFMYTRKVGSNNVIYSGTDTDEGIGNQLIFNENEFQITPLENNSFRPRKNNTASKVAFLQTVGADTHLFIMNPNGTEIRQVTSDVPVAGFRQSELDFIWTRNGQQILYQNFNKLYSINSSGTGNAVVYEAPAGSFITEVDTNEVNNQIAIKTNDLSGYNARIFIINPSNGTEVNVVVENLPGALGGIDFSIDGTKVLYTRDISGFESPDYRQLDSRIFEYDITLDVTTEIETSKPPGFNDLDVKYSPDEGGVVYTSTSNDGISQKDIYVTKFNDLGNREKVFTDASMPDWK